MTTTNACRAGLAAAIGAWTVTTAMAEPAATARHGDVVAFCKAHRSVDFPGRLFFGPGYTPGAIPQQLSKLDGPLQWRCLEGRVWVCLDSADGDWCSKKDVSRRPSPLLRQACREDPERVSLSFAEEHYSAFDWRCKGGTPVIIQSYPLDQHGFFKASWTPLVVRRGVVIGPTELPAGPR
jgi:hypothetical protein